MAWYDNVNPFSKRESHSPAAILTFKLFTVISWLLIVISSVYYTFNASTGHHHNKHWQHTIWGQNDLHRTPFALNSVIVSVYWIVLWILQVGYVSHFFSSENDNVTHASNVGTHFILNNLLQFVWLMLFVRSYFVWAEIILIVNFFNLTMLYFRHNTYPRFIHIPVVSGPLAWNYVALYWNGAIAVNSHSLPARIVANIFIWGILFYGLFFLIAYKDYTMGFSLSILAAALGVGQFFLKLVALQWIFAFTIMATLFLFTTVIALPGIFGETNFRRDTRVLSEDAERAPLLDDH